MSANTGNNGHPMRHHHSTKIIQLRALLIWRSAMTYNKDQKQWGEPITRCIGSAAGRLIERSTKNEISRSSSSSGRPAVTLLASADDAHLAEHDLRVRHLPLVERVAPGRSHDLEDGGEVRNVVADGGKLAAAVEQPFSEVTICWLVTAAQSRSAMS